MRVRGVISVKRKKNPSIIMVIASLIFNHICHNILYTMVNATTNFCRQGFHRRGSSPHFLRFSRSHASFFRPTAETANNMALGKKRSFHMETPWKTWKNNLNNQEVESLEFVNFPGSKLPRALFFVNLQSPTGQLSLQEGRVWPRKIGSRQAQAMAFVVKSC